MMMTDFVDGDTLDFALVVGVDLSWGNSDGLDVDLLNVC